jgi:hypothetical protein
MKYPIKAFYGTMIIYFLFAGCAKKSAEYSEQAAIGNAAYMLAMDGNIAAETDGKLALKESRHVDESVLLGNDISSRKLITNSNIEIRTENLEACTDALSSILKKYNAYTSSVSIYENSRNYTIKVAAEKYTSFFYELTGLGKVINYTESTEDVTMRYYDLESRLNIKKALLKTYQNYLVQTKNIEEILAVESKIAELQSELDDAGSQFRLLNNLIDYSTIYVEMYRPITAADYDKETIGDRIKEMLSGFGYYVSTIVIILIGIVVYGIPALVILALLYWLLLGKIGLVRRIYKFSAKKPAGKIANASVD